MRRTLPVLALLLCCGAARAHGLLIPEEKSVPPLAMLSHKVHIAIEDQVAVTTVEQTFRNSTDQSLAASYFFPVPKGASVQKFSMWLDGKEVKGSWGSSFYPTDAGTHSLSVSYKLYWILSVCKGAMSVTVPEGVGHGGFGPWSADVSRIPGDIKDILARHASAAP